MMLAFLKQPSPVDADLYFLAYQLRKTVAEIEMMPHQEYVNWRAFFTAKHALENMRQVGGSGSGG